MRGKEKRGGREIRQNRQVEDEQREGRKRERGGQKGVDGGGLI